MSRFLDLESGRLLDLPDEMQTNHGDLVIFVKSGSRDLQPGETSIVVETLAGERQEIIFPAPKQHRIEASVESALEDEHAAHRYGEKWNRSGEYAAYRERVEAQFSAPVPKNSDLERAISVVISGFEGVGKSTVGRIIASALADHGVAVSLQGQRARDGIASEWSPKWPREPMSVELWEVDRASPHNH